MPAAPPAHAPKPRGKAPLLAANVPDPSRFGACCLTMLLHIATDGERTGADSLGIASQSHLVRQRSAGAKSEGQSPVNPLAGDRILRQGGSTTSNTTPAPLLRLKCVCEAFQSKLLRKATLRDPLTRSARHMCPPGLTKPVGP